MTKIIVADTGPLIALALVNLLPRAAEFLGEIHVPKTVLAEAVQDISKPGAQIIQHAFQQGFIIQHTVTLTAQYQEILALLDLGEIEAFILAEQLNAHLLIDEKRGRRVAKERGIKITGTAATLIKAKQTHIIYQVKPLLDILTQQGYRLSQTVTSEILILCGE